MTFRNNHSPNDTQSIMMKRLSMVCCAFLIAVSGRAAEPQTVTIRDVTGRGFAADLVNYTIDALADGGASLRAIDADGKPLPVQVTPGEQGKATLSFVAAVPPGGTSAYTIRSDAAGPAAPPAVSAAVEGDAFVLGNQMLAVKVPAPQEKTFEKPVAADTLPAPVLAFRGPDGGWRGAGSLLLKRPVKKFSVTQSAKGPVFVEMRYRLDYEEGGFYAARVRVTDRAPFAVVTEECDLGATKNADFWQLDLSKGWKPDTAEHMSVAGQGYSPVVTPSLADEEKATASGPSVGSIPSGGAAQPTRCIHHDSCWGSRYVSAYGIHSAAAAAATPDNYPLAIVAPLHKGFWRRANSVPVFVKGGEVTVRFPMDVAPISWQNEPGSDVSPFSCHEHDPALPATYSRREWALVLAQPTMRVAGYGDPKMAGVGYSVRNLYGTVGLDRYKDFVLSWPDGKVVYPRVFITPDGVAKYRAAVKADSSFPLDAMVKDYYWFTGDEATARTELPKVIAALDRNIEYVAKALSIHHHHTLEAYGTPIGHAESVLSWPGLPAADREAIRSRLAALCYLLTDPDVTSAGDGSHHGNPNMGISRLMDRSNLVALIPDHPHHKAWSDYTSRFMAYKTGSFMAPEGAWFEYGASYHMHGYGKILRGLMGVLADKPPAAESMWNYNRIDFDYYLNLLSPVDPRFGARTIPGTANSPVGSPPHYIQAMGSVADRDPGFAANLRWAWDASGRMIGSGGDGITLPAMVRPEIPAREPKLTSRHYPGFGVIFRGHQGADETCLYLRSGHLWSHWNHDQGNLMLYAKGAVLLPPQPYQYGGPKDNAFPDKNFLRFGDPTQDLPHAWADSNVLDTAFGANVDYAWSSTGYPDWFITPGAKPGWGDPRKLVGGLDQKEGGFTWDRQIAFLKGATGKSPNYFVIRDTTSGAGKLASWFNLNLLGRKDNLKVEGPKITLDTEWPTKLDLLFTDREKPAFEMAEDALPVGLVGIYSTLSGDVTEGKVPSRDWVGPDGKPKAVGKNVVGDFGNVKEQHVALRLQSGPGKEVAWVLYPRAAGEAAATATQLAPGVTKVVTAEGTDYVFLSTTPLAFSGEGVEFSGLAGAVRVAKNGKATLVLSAGPGSVGYKGTVVTSAAPFEKTVTAGGIAETVAAPATTIQLPATVAAVQPVVDGVTKATTDAADGKKVVQYMVDAPAAITATDGDVRLHARRAVVEVAAGSVRFVVPERAYARLSSGNVGVRGMGPFDLTFTPAGITGRVDGDIRTLVTTWPEQIIRPGYAMDGVRWHAGFADEHSIVKGTKTPQFGIAMGVAAGPHAIAINEWEWPAMPPTPPRQSLR